MKEKIAACVILYHPKKEDLDNLKSYMNKVSILYVFDNTENKSNLEYFENIENVLYFSDLENQGLSIRLNQACKLAINDGYEYLLTMDQDSSFNDENLDKYLESVANYKDKENVNVYGIEYNKNDLKDNFPYYEEVDHVITSACIMNLKVFDKVGGFDESFFIDSVDIDYCYAGLVKGYKNIKFTNLFFEHSLGESFIRGSITSLYFHKKTVKIHSGVRIYYMYRNLLYMEKKYTDSLHHFSKKLKKNQLKHIKRCVKYSDNFIKTCKIIIKAKKDFKNNRMGKIINNHL